MTRRPSRSTGRCIVEVANRQKAVRISRRFVTNIAQLALSDEQVAAAQISVALVSNAEMHAINREFLAHDYPTDVVSFLLECEITPTCRERPLRRSASVSHTLSAKRSSPSVRASVTRAERHRGRSLQDIPDQRMKPGPPPSRRGTGKRIEGEIIISAEYAADEAARYRWPPEHEIALYLVHGLLHLCGYDDLSIPEKRRMRTRERQILKLLNIEAKYSRKR